MKLVMKIPFFRHLFSRPISSNNFSTSNFSANTPLIHTLSSFIFLTSSTTIPTSPSPPNSQNNESHNTHFPISPYSTSQFPRAWSKSIHKFDPFPSNTHLPIFQNHSTPHHQFTHRRLFSSVRPDPSSNDPPSPNEIHVVSSVNSPFESSTSIDAGSSIRKPISLWPGMYHSPVTNALWEARSSIFEKPQEIPSDDAASGSKLVPKTPAQSRTSITYKFSSDYILREQYRNPWNEMRTGKLLEDLDALAGTISFKHCSNHEGATRPLLLVTASVDRMVLKKPIRVDTDLKIVGAVTWVGRSSMEIRLEVIQPIEEASDDSDSLALTANFTFVARDSNTGKSAPINQISPETEQEKLLWREAEDQNQIRKKKRENKKDMDAREAGQLTALLAEGRVFCDMPALADRDSILIRDTHLEYSFICQPQQRNIHGRIFGGFLMRVALELAFSTTYAFAGAAPLFLEVDHVDFLKPVDVGNFLRLKSCVLYTELENPTRPLINVEVVAHVTSPEIRSSEVSNTFYFTFTARPEAMENGLKIRNVVPATEEEARRVLKRMDAENPEQVQNRKS